MMKLETRLIVIRVRNLEAPKGLVKETKEILDNKRGWQKTLQSPEQAVTTTDPYTEEEYPEEPSYVTDGCLVTVRLWWDVFKGPAVSIIIVGEPEKARELGSLFKTGCTLFYLKHKTQDMYDQLDFSDNQFDCPDNFDWLDSYYYAELLVRDLREGSVWLEEYEGKTLWDSIKDIQVIGKRLSGEPEVLHEIEDSLRAKEFPANRPQIQRVLESVPHIFPKDWISPEDYDSLSEQQRIIYRQLAGLGVHLTGPQIQEVIEMAKQYA